MSVQSAIGNFTRGAQDTISDILTGAKTNFDGIVGTTSTALGSLWSGGFVGMSESGMEQLKQAIETYCTEIEAIINEFNEEGDIDNALKGDVNTAARDFIHAVKELLQAYVSRMRQEKIDADEAWNNWKQASQDISQNVTSDAEQIRSDAASIRID